MNKTLKTIGWICLALGLLGILADGGAFVLGRQWIADRQTTAEEFLATVTESKQLKASDYCLAKDEDGDGKPDGVCLQLPAIRDKLSRRGAMRPDSRLMQFPRTRLNANRFGFGGGGLILLFALGPILAVVGAVILLVNRTPKPQTALAAEEKKASKDKMKKSS